MLDLCTIGYENAAWPAVLASLRAAGVEQVIDVRQLPLSRRPGFSKTPLRAGLAEAGLGYVHLRALGTPPEGREANRKRQWDRFWPIVDASLGTLEAGRRPPASRRPRPRPPELPPLLRSRPPHLPSPARGRTARPATASPYATCARKTAAAVEPTGPPEIARLPPARNRHHRAARIRSRR